MSPYLSEGLQRDGKNIVEISEVNLSLLDTFRSDCVVMSNTGRIDFDCSYRSVLIKYKQYRWYKFSCLPLISVPLCKA